jgi:regulatory protein
MVRDHQPTPGSLADLGPDADPEQVARTIALRRLEAAPRTRAELAQTLTKRGIPTEVSERVLDRFTEVGLIDDVAFAKLWVESRHRGKALARSVLRHELRQRGVAPEVIDEAVESIDDDDEGVRAREFARGKARIKSGEDPRKAVQRLAGQLARKGYPPGLCFAAAREALSSVLQQRQDDAIDDLGAGVVVGDFPVDQ